MSFQIWPFWVTLNVKSGIVKPPGGQRFEFRAYQLYQDIRIANGEVGGAAKRKILRKAKYKACYLEESA